MARYIDADKVLPKIQYRERTYGCSKKMYSKIIKGTPTADVRPERHGRWVFREIATDDGTCYNWCCNQCDCSCSLLDEGIEPDFCPNCGAKMDGGDE